MKKILFTFLVFAFCLGLQAQKITALPAVTSAPTGSLLMIRSGSTGDVLSRITEANLFSPLLKVKDSTAYVKSYMSRFDAVTGLALKVNISDSASMLTKYITTSEARDVIADSLNALRNAAVQIEDVAVMLVPDTVHVTSATYTILVTDANKRVYFTDNFCLITLPSDATAAIPVGTTINVMSYGGLMKFQAGANAVLKAPKDSVTTSNAYDRVGLEKTAANKWTIYGSLKD